MNNLDEKTKMFLFTRWMAMHYGHVLNNKTGHWYLEKMHWFFKYVLENYIDNGTYLDTREFIQKQYEQEQQGLCNGGHTRGIAQAEDMSKLS